MSPDQQAPASGAAAVTGVGCGHRVIVNPLSGERITIRAPAAGSAVLAWELELAPGGRVPASHAHPEQEECFTVLAGQMKFRVGRRRIVAGPGDTVRAPQGTVHHFANACGQPARVAVLSTPALGMAGLLETAAALAQHQQAATGRIRRRMPPGLRWLMPARCPARPPWRCSCATSPARCRRRISRARWSAR